jgi:ATP-dependent Lon protease
MDKKYRRPASQIMFPDILDGDGDIIPIIADGDDGDLEDVDVPDVIPILSLRNTVLFPGVVLPISIGRPRSIQLIKDAYRHNKIVGTVAQKDPDTENPEFDDLHKIGTVGQIVKLLEMPDGSTTAIIQGRKRMVL